MKVVSKLSLNSYQQMPNWTFYNMFTHISLLYRLGIHCALFSCKANKFLFLEKL